MMPSLILTIRISLSISPMTVTLILLIILTFSAEPGDYPDMSTYLGGVGATISEELPYVAGYCGEFREGITQQAGPRRIPGL